MPKQLEKKDQKKLLRLLKQEKDRIIDRMEIAADDSKIESLEDELNLTNKCINCISDEKTLTENLIKHIRNVLFFHLTRIIHDNGDKDIDDYFSIARSLEIKDELDDLLKIFDERVGLHS